jgi:putative transposase
MIFEKGNVYHIYNQGNNKSVIFFKKENYHYFINKIKAHICPFADVIAWCLMPTHFHLMIAVHKTDPLQSLNHSIGTMLRSYTRAINIQEKRTGSLFRENTKAEFLDSIEAAKIKKKNRSRLNNTAAPETEEDYMRVCYKYILNNPVKAGLTKHVSDWEYSSYHSMNNHLSEGVTPNHTLIWEALPVNKKLIGELGLWT